MSTPGLIVAPLVVFFPTEKETFLGFLAQGPYRTTPARDNVPGHDPSNQLLVRETGTLLGDVLRELRDDGLLTVEALQALPLEEARFPAGSMFRPLFDAVGEILTAEAMIPVAGGGYGVAVDLELAGGTGVAELLDPEQLGVLCGADRPVRFADASITEHLAPVLWRYLRDEIGIDEVTPAEVVARVTREFLEAQPDEWITRFYAFLYHNSPQWEAARSAPIIRLEDGSQVVPFDDQDRIDEESLRALEIGGVALRPAEIRQVPVDRLHRVARADACGLEHRRHALERGIAMGEDAARGRGSVGLEHAVRRHGMADRQQTGPLGCLLALVTP